MQWELPCINHVMVTHPFKRIPHDICPREEIASPSKLLALCQVRQNGWDPVTIHGEEYHRAWIQMRIRYPSLSTKVSSMGFYGLASDQQMFTSVLEVEDDKNEIITWLRNYGLSPFIITCPLFSYRTKYQEVLYTLTNTFPQRVLHIAPMTDLTTQMINSNAYTIGNGLTLAIAMHRLGFWADPTFSEALAQWLEEEELAYTNITPELQPLIVQHLIPQVCDHPYFYACMGSQKASISVIETLRSKYALSEPFIQQQSEEYRVLTSAALQALPYTPLHILDHVTKYAIPSGDDEEDESDDLMTFTSTRTDIGGLLHALFTKKGLWKRWLNTYHESLVRYSDVADSTEDFIDRTLKRTFMLYKKGSHHGKVYTSRIRTFWKQVMEVLDPKQTRMQKWIHKYVIMEHINQELEKQNVYGAFWLPKVPVAFFVEMLRIYGSKWSIFDPSATNITIMTSYEHICNIFPEAIVEVDESNPSRPYKIIKIRRSLYSYLQHMPKHSTMHCFAKLIKETAQERLRILHTGFMRPAIPRLNENDGYTIWMILQDYFKTNKEALCV